MAKKKIKFALKLKEGVEARSLQELREAFDLNQIVAYFLDGKLETWLLDRYYEDLAEKISNLDKSDPELRKKLCKIFEVEYEEDCLSIEEIEERNRRIKKLKEVTDDEEIIKNVDKVAFCQEELADLLDEGQKTIYLCGTDFHIPVSKKGIRYIGVETKLDITQEEREKYQANDIELIDLLEGYFDEFKEEFDERIQEAMIEHNDDILLDLTRYHYLSIKSLGLSKLVKSKNGCMKFKYSVYKRLMDIYGGNVDKATPLSFLSKEEYEEMLIATVSGILDYNDFEDEEDDFNEDAEEEFDDSGEESDEDETEEEEVRPGEKEIHVILNGKKITVPPRKKGLGGAYHLVGEIDDEAIKEEDRDNENVIKYYIKINGKVVRGREEWQKLSAVIKEGDVIEFAYKFVE